MLALCDGEAALPLAPAWDFKRIGEADTGPNTGGMVAFSPVEGADAVLIEQVRAGRSASRSSTQLARRGIPPFHGVLYAGLTLTADGRKVIEFNCAASAIPTQVVPAPEERHVLGTLPARGAPGAWRAPTWSGRAAAVTGARLPRLPTAPLRPPP